MGDSATFSISYPEMARRMKERKSRHPRDDAFETYENWVAAGRVPLVHEGEDTAPAPAPAVAKKKELTEAERFESRRRQIMSKQMSTRRSTGGKLCAPHTCTPARRCPRHFGRHAARHIASELLPLPPCCASVAIGGGGPGGQSYQVV